VNSEHWTSDELLEVVYGLREPSPHIASCEECRLRLESIEQRRRAVAAPPDVPDAWLHAQRQRIFERVDAVTSRVVRRWTPSLAASAVVLLGLILLAPSPQPQRTVSAPSDAELFSEIHAILDSPEPRAAAPIRNLFQE